MVAAGEVQTVGGAALRDMPRAAQELLTAARTLLARGGWDALTLDAIVAEAGKGKASVKYYFGNKDGLILALMEMLDSELFTSLVCGFDPSESDDPVDDYVEVVRGRLRQTDEFRMFFDLVPHVIRVEERRARLAGLYEMYCRSHLELLRVGGLEEPSEREEALAMGSLLLAVIDGLALQVALEPRSLDVERVLAVWRRMLKGCLLVSQHGCAQETGGPAGQEP